VTDRRPVRTSSSSARLQWLLCQMRERPRSANSTDAHCMGHAAHCHSCVHESCRCRGCMPGCKRGLRDSRDSCPLTCEKRLGGYPWHMPYLPPERYLRECTVCLCMLLQMCVRVCVCVCAVCVCVRVRVCVAARELHGAVIMKPTPNRERHWAVAGSLVLPPICWVDYRDTRTTITSYACMGLSCSTRGYRGCSELAAMLIDRRNGCLIALIAAMHE
jgi:hypothetical protein